jgi:large subunit ribosomal protein L15
MNLTDLRPNEGASRKRKIVGRGRGSGHGKTSTRGHNGQGQRSGESRRFGFEGGQTPLFRRLPKLHNFDQVNTRDWVEVNVGALNVLPANTEVNAVTLVEHKLLRSHTDSLRILGNGELKVALKVKAHHCSAGARTKIEAAGGSVEVVEVKVIEGKRSKRLAKAYAREELRRNSPKPSEALKAAKAEEAEKAKAKAAEKGGKSDKAKAPEKTEHKKPAGGGGDKGKGGDKKSGDKKGADKKK